MKRWRMLTIGQTDILVHPAVLPFAAYAILLGHGMLWLMSMMSILVHEAAHALAAAAFGNVPAALELTPLGAVMLLEDELKLPPLKRAAMLLAGPTASLVMAGLALWLTDSSWLAPAVGSQLFLCNIAIVMINLLPVFPLDGGRLLHLLLAGLLPAQLASKIMRMLGGIVGIGLIMLNIIVSVRHGGWNLSLAFAGCTILYSTAAALTTEKLRELRVFMERKIALERRGYQPCRLLCAMGNYPLRRLLHALPGNRQVLCALLEPGSMALLGVISENQMIQHYLDWPGITLSEALLLSENAIKTTKDDTI